MVFNFVLVFLLGVVLTLVVVHTFHSGTIRIDRTNPAKDVYRLEIDNLDSLSRKKFVTLKVDSHAKLSQE